MIKQDWTAELAKGHSEALQLQWHMLHEQWTDMYMHCTAVETECQIAVYMLTN